MKPIPKINPNGTITIWDSDTTMTVFDGTKNIQIPVSIFTGTLADAQNRFTDAKAKLIEAQGNLTQVQAIIDTINSAIPPVI